jgi:ParB family chromosome partitioning protein
VGKNRSTIANSLRLLGLSVEAQAALSDGTITAGHARALLMIPEPAERQRLFERLKQYSVREAEEYAAKVRARLTEAGLKKGVVDHRQRRVVDPHLEELEQRLIDSLQTKVSVRGSKGRGKIEIRFFNSDDLERIQSVLLADK